MGRIKTISQRRYARHFAPHFTCQLIHRSILASDVTQDQNDAHLSHQTPARFTAMKITELPASTQEKLEAATFRRLLAHLDSRKDVQNIELMNLAGFCRNCLSKWYVAAAQEEQITLDYEDARERVYGIPYSEWKTQYQQEASAEQLQAFAAKKTE